MENKKGLLVNILISKKNIDCSNNGISNKYDNLILISSNDFLVEGPFYDENLEKYVKIEHIEFGNNKHYRAVPVYESDADKKRHRMFGGNFIYSSDSRFPTGRPIPIHDRYEDYR